MRFLVVEKYTISIYNYYIWFRSKESEEICMLRCSNYVFANSLEEAYELNKKRTNVIVAGNGWVKMGNKQWNTVIDISRLALDTITEDNEKFEIGAMVTLRDIENNAALNEYTKGAVKESVKHIVGTQFRNCVTVGGSIFGRFGFSDVLTVFLGLDTYVEMYKGGIMPLIEFAKTDYDNDILVKLIVKKTPLKIAYSSFRNQATDFPVLTCCISVSSDDTNVVIGARPFRAYAVNYGKNILENIEDTDKFVHWAANSFDYYSNMRAGKDYRKHIAEVLIRRTLNTIKAEG